MITIRNATSKDAKKISYLIQKNTIANPSNYNEDQIEAWVKYNTPSKIKEQIKDRDVYCAFKHNKLIGTIGLQSNEVVGFYVSYSQRGKGIGKQLLGFVEGIVVQNGFRQMLLTSTPGALEFYKKNNFNLLKKITVVVDSISYEEFTMSKKI